MRPSALLPAALLGFLASGMAQAQETPIVGVAAPLTGPSAILGRQIAGGAGEAAGSAATVIAADSGCTADGGAAAARALIEQGVEIVVGFLCTAEIEAALPILTEAGIPVIDVGVRANRLTDRRERTGHLVWRLAPRTDDEAEALAGFVRANWRNEPFGIVEDGSSNARDLADEVRARLAPDAIEPSLVDNYRPAEEVQFALARRIAQSGVTRLLAFGTRGDIAILSRDAAAIDLDLAIVGGESLLDEPNETATLAEGTRAVAVDENAADYAAGSVAIVREGYHGPAYASVEIALQAIGLANGEARLSDVLNTQTFPTVLGPIAFSAQGDAERDAFAVLRWDGAAFVPEPQS